MCAAIYPGIREPSVRSADRCFIEMISMKDESRPHGSRPAHREETTAWIRFHAVADGPEGLATLLPGDRRSLLCFRWRTEVCKQRAVFQAAAIIAVDDGAAVSELQGVRDANRAMPSSRRAMKGDARTRSADCRKHGRTCVDRLKRTMAVERAAQGSERAFGLPQGARTERCSSDEIPGFRPDFGRRQLSIDI
jgi:hypothetical protein